MDKHVFTAVGNVSRLAQDMLVDRHMGNISPALGLLR